MKFRAFVQFEYDDVFVPIARQIAEGEPPPWLLVSLNHFSADIGRSETGGPDDKIIIKRMADATDMLIKWLPVFGHMPFGLHCPDDVAVVLEALPRIKAELDRLSRKREGRPQNIQKALCAAVIVEVWKLCHGEAKPRSIRLYEACDAYWRACGGVGGKVASVEERWRGPVKQTTDNEELQKIILYVQNSI